VLSRWKAESRPVAPAAGRQAAAVTRNSNGLEQFIASLQDRDGLSILDFSGASQANISFITNLGHRIYSEDVVGTIEEVFGKNGANLESQTDAARVDAFLAQTLDFQDGAFDGALVWDTLQFLSPQLVEAVVDRLQRILRPNAVLLAFFNANEKVHAVPVYAYRITDSKTLSLTTRGERATGQFFNNRTIEKLFQRFHSVKFFLTRDNLREVIVRR